ncbi:ROK family transcriptional regulator [Diaminobutyricibacter sp. McL0608]|uniref:ROK family transcriptional regulator n=1 Tax=Leifsonia sp. McL0608 TaxID=3143537 RepID=UPI0031F32214
MNTDSALPRRAAGSLVSSDVRTHNLALVMRTIAESGPSARSDLATATGLTRGSITALVGALSDAGLVRESVSVPGEGSGRPKTLIGIAADRLALVAVQIDADLVTVVVHDLAGRVLDRAATHHGRPMGDPDTILDLAAERLRAAFERIADAGRRIAGLTVIVFAPVGGDPRVVVADTDLGWGRVDVLAGLEARIPGFPADATLTADAPLAALAERRLLGDVDDVLYLKSNSGIGGAIISNGQLVEGANAIAGSVGHIAIDHDGARCECGQRGCLVTVAGPDVVLGRAGLGPLLASSGLTAALDELVARVRAEEPDAAAAFADAADWIARAVAILRMTVDPQVVVLGGYWADLADLIADAAIPRLQLAADPSLRDSETARSLRVVAGSLGGDAALTGAFWQLRDDLLADPLALVDLA